MSINSRSDPSWHLADALSEDILNTGAEDLFGEVAEDHQDRRALVTEFDRIFGRGLRRVRRQELKERLKQFLVLFGRETAEDAGRSRPAHDRAKALSSIGPVLAKRRQAASKQTPVQVGGAGSTPKIAYQGRVHGVGLLQRTEQASDPRYDNDDERWPSRDAPRWMDPVDIYAFLKTNRRVIAGWTIAAVMLALVYAYTATPLYTATAVLRLDSKNVELIKTNDQVGKDSSLDTSLKSEAEVLRSDSIALAVVNDLQLTEDPEFVDSNPGIISAIFDGTFRSPSEDVRKRIAVRALQDNLIIRRVGLTDVLEVSFRSPDREKAAPIANAVAQAYVNDQLNTEYESARRAGTWWRARLSELREQASAGRLAETYKNDFEIAKQRNDDVQKEHDLAVAQAEQNNQAQAVAQAEQNNQAQAVTQAEQNNQSQVVLSDLESKSETYRALYDNFLQRDMDSAQQQSFPIADAHVIALATLPFHESYPKTTLVALLGLLAGLCGGVGHSLVLRNRAAYARAT